MQERVSQRRSAGESLRNCLQFLIPALFTTLSPAFGGSDLGPIGTFEKWSEIEIVLTGPSSVGLSNSPNPFKTSVDVLFSGPGGAFYEVPAFYDGNGSGGLNGSVWKVRFAADTVGVWSFVSDSTNGLLDGYQGTFTVISPSPFADQFVKWGRLEHNAGDHYLKFRDGPYWVAGGLDEPEDFLSPDVMGSWPEKKAAVDYLTSKGVNAIILVLMNVQADGDNVWPWVAPTDSEHFDVAKLANWKDLFDHMQSRGLVLHLFFEDDYGWTGFNRSLYYREMIARFGHYNGLYWNVAEEFIENYSTAETRVFAQQIRAQDPYNLPISAHTHKGQTEWEALLGDQNFGITAFQSLEQPQNDRTISWREDSAAAGWPVAVAYTETGKSTPTDRDLARHIEWSVYMGGGNYILHPFPVTTFEEFELLWDDLRHARLFVESLPVEKMEPDNDLVIGGSGEQYCLRQTGRIYVVYLSVGGPVSLNLTGGSGPFPVVWYNPRTGQSFDSGEVQGGSVVSLGTPPFSGDAVVTVGSANNVPVAEDLRLSTSVDSDLPVTLRFSDPDGPGPYVYTVNAPSNGTLSGDPPGFLYTPGPDFVAIDTFTWSVSDGEEESNVATVTITIMDGTVLLKDDFLGVDSEFVGNGWVERETATGSTSIQNGALVFDALDDAFRPLVEHAVPPFSSGAVTLTFEIDFKRSGSEGTYAFWMQIGEHAQMSDVSPTESGVAVNLKWGSPTEGLANHEGLGYVLDGAVTQIDTVTGLQVVGIVADLDRQTYDVSVGEQQVDAVPFDESVSIDTIRFFTNGLRSPNFSSRTIDNVQYFVTRQPNVVPVAQGQSVLTVVDRPVNVELGFTDPDGPPPHVYAVNAPAIGTLTGDPPDLTYTPAPGFFGLDAFTWSVSDEFDESGLGTVTIEVLESNTAPVAEDGAALTLLEVPVVVSLNVMDSDGPRPLTFTVIDPANGSLSGTPPDLTYIAAAGFSGSDAITWSANDGIFESNEATLTVEVLASNDTPVAQGAALQTSLGVPVDFTLTHVDPDGPGPYVYDLGDPANGTLSGTAPELTYTPNARFFGIDTFTWSVDDRFSRSEIAVVTVHVVTGNAPPVALDDTLQTIRDVSVDFALTHVDPDGPGPYVYALSDPANGTLGGTPPQLTYNPSPGFFGIDSFSWTIDDGLFESDVGTVTVITHAENTAPVAEGQSLRSLAGVPIDILLNANDADGPDALVYTVSNPASGFLSGTPPALTYTSIVAGLHSFTWSVHDGLFDSLEATITIEVFATNVPPDAEEQNVSTFVGRAVGIVLDANDPDGPDPLQYTVAPPANGSLSGTPPDLTYTPDADFSGRDAFTWSVFDGFVDSELATVTIDVATNVAPVVEDQMVSAPVGGQVAIALSFVDPDGPGPFTYDVLRDPVAGFLTGTPPDLTYTRIGSLATRDFFTWSVSDGVDDSNVARVTIDPKPPFRRGDANDDGVTNITDVIRIIDHVYLGGPPSSCAAAMDVSNGGPAEAWSGLLWSYLYSAVEALPPPPAPGPDFCGPAPAGSVVDCDAYSSCDGPTALPDGPPLFDVHFDAPPKVSGTGAVARFQVDVMLDVAEIDEAAGEGVRGLSLGIGAIGCAIRSAIVSGADVNQFIELTDGPGNAGVVVAVVLPCPGVLVDGDCDSEERGRQLGDGTYLLVTLEVEAEAPDGDCVPCTLELVDGLQGQHMPQPVENIIEVVGVSFSPTAEAATIEICGEPELAPFLRGDCDGDGRIGGSPTDAVVLLDWAFRGGIEPPCLAACDMNVDGLASGSPTDAVLLLQFAFLGGEDPPAPFPVCDTSSLETDIRLGCGMSPPGCR